MLSLLSPDLGSASPLATLIASLFTVAIAAGLYALFRRWRGPGGRKSRLIEAIVTFSRNVDGALVRYGSWWVGTRVPRPWPRHGVTLSIFIVIAACGALFPWPLCLWVLSFGLLNVFIVFRHWSRDADEAKSQVGLEDKQIRIDGDLSIEMATAGAFVLVYATTAFAQIQAAQQGFQMPADAGPFTFVRYALVEVLKVAPLVSYYDLFAGNLPLDNPDTVAAASISAKWAVMIFRAALVLIVLAGLKHLIDFIRSGAEQMDLRPILAVLNDSDADQGAVQQAVDKLTTLATRGRRRAAELLEQIVTEVRHGKPQFAASVRFAAANGLVSYAKPRPETGKLLAAIEGYRKLALDDWPQESAPIDWAAAQHSLGIALRTLGEHETGTVRLEAAVAALQETLKERTRERAPLEWAATQNDLGKTLWQLGERESGTAHLEQAAAAFREALQERTQESAPRDWAATQDHLGVVLRALGERAREPAQLEEAVAIYQEALKERTRESAPLEWAATQNNLGNALRVLGERESGSARLEESAAAYREALKEYTRERAPLEWAAAQNNLGTVLQTLGERAGDTARIEEAIATYREALKERTRERAPLDWAATQNNLGTALQTLGDGGSDMGRLEEAVTAYREALKERTRKRAALDWATTQSNLGNALCGLGERESGTTRFEQAVTAYREALKERTRDREPVAWAMTQNNLGNALRALGERENGTTHFEEAVTAFGEAARELTQEKSPQHHEIVRQNLARILSALERRKAQPFDALASRRV
jgi:tetratricopeptide (TPR) repeat protein